MNKNICRHYNGVFGGACKAGIEKQKPLKGCLSKEETKCDKYESFTPEEIKQRELEDKKIAEDTIKMLKDNLSPCCNVDIDKSAVIKEGAHKGHGGRYCSKCKKLLFWV